MAKGKPEAKLIRDDIMSKQSSFFGTATLSRAYDLAGPRPDTGPVIRANENWECLGSMRRPDRSVLSHDGYRRAGGHLRDMVERFVDQYPDAMEIAGTGVSVTGFDEAIKTEFRERWLRTLGFS